MCRVLLNSIEKVKQFVNITSGFDINVFLKSGRYVIDAKSILGIFSVDLTKPMIFEIDEVDKYDEYMIDTYMSKISEFIV